MNLKFPTEELEEESPPSILEDRMIDSLQPEYSVKISYPFVDLIRFVSTIGIVYIHTEFFITKNDPGFFHRVPHVEYYFMLRQVCKFSTICYFMLAGFLLGDKIENNQRFKYFMRRVNVIAKPYILAVAIFIIALIIDRPVNQKINLYYLLETCKDVIFYTPYWYIPNFLTCLLVVVCFAKYVRSIYFGGFLLLVTLIYTYFNVYSANHSGSHTTALFGFVFYMWLGMYIKQTGLVSKIQKLNLAMLGGIVLTIFILANYEIWYLFNYTHTTDSLNSLRVSNQLYSVAMFVLMVRWCVKKPNFGIFKPRQETYGIYLYHSFFIFFITRGVEVWLCKLYDITLLSNNVYQLIAINITNFVICYLVTTATVKLLVRYKLAYLPYD